MSEELKPCPFCGSARALVTMAAAAKFVRCARLDGGCGAEGPVKQTVAEAVAAWNRRPTSDTVQS